MNLVKMCRGSQTLMTRIGIMLGRVSVTCYNYPAYPCISKHTLWHTQGSKYTSHKSERRDRSRPCPVFRLTRPLCIQTSGESKYNRQMVNTSAHATPVLRQKRANNKAGQRFRTHPYSFNAPVQLCVWPFRCSLPEKEEIRVERKKRINK